MSYIYILTFCPVPRVFDVVVFVVVFYCYVFACMRVFCVSSVSNGIMLNLLETVHIPALKKALSHGTVGWSAACDCGIS